MACSCDTLTRPSGTLSRKRERVGPAAKPWEGEGSCLLHLLDDLHLRAVRRFEEADMAAVVVHLLEDLDAVLLEPRERRRVVVGLQRDMLDAELLLMILGCR